MFLGGVGFLTTLGVGIRVRFFSLAPTVEVQLDNFYVTLLSWVFLLK